MSDSTPPAPEAPSPARLRLALLQGKSEPRDNVVRALRDALARAEAGELVSVAIAYEERTGEAGYYVAHGAFSTPGRLLGEVALLQHVLASKIAAGLGAVEGGEAPPG